METWVLAFGTPITSLTSYLLNFILERPVRHLRYRVAIPAMLISGKKRIQAALAAY